MLFFQFSNGIIKHLDSYGGDGLHYFQTLITTERKKIKYQLLLILIIIFSLASLIFTLIQDKPFLLEKIMSEQKSVQTILLDFQKMNTDSEEAKGNKLYLNFVEQSELLAKAEMALRFEKNTTLAETAISLSKIRNDFYSLSQNSTSYLKSIPDKNENQLNEALYQSLLTQNKSIYEKNNNLVTATLILLSLLSVIWFPLASLVASDSLLEEIKHLSLNSGFPISFRKKIFSKISFMLIYFILALLMIPLIIVSLTYFFPSGDWGYPVAVFVNGYTTIPVWQYVTLHLLSYLLIGIFIALLSIFINYLVNDLYITMFISFSFYLLPYFFPNIAKLLWFLPSIYLNPTTSLAGQFLNHNFLGSFLCGILILSGWSIAILLLLSRLLTSQSLRERRL